MPSAFASGRRLRPESECSSTVIRLDAVFEAGLGAALLAGVGRYPVPHVAVLAVGVALVAVGGFLWLGRIGLRDLALANAATAIAAVVWLVLDSGFSTAGAVVLAVAAALLAVLALVEAATLRA